MTSAMPVFPEILFTSLWASAQTPPRYLVFFKGRDADALTAAFKEFSAKKLTQDKKPSIRKALAAFREKAKELNASRQQTKHKDREVSL